MTAAERASELQALGRALRVLRVRAGLSQGTLGERVGIHQNQIGRIERSEVNTSFVMLVILVRGLGVPLSQLIREFEQLRREQ